MELIDSMASHIGKVDRLAEAKARHEARWSEVLEPRTKTEKLLKSTSDLFSSKLRIGSKIPSNVCARTYSQLVEARHNIWVEMFDELTLYNNAGGFDKVNFHEFCLQLNEVLALEGDGKFVSPPDLVTKKPDILIYKREHNLIYLGDFAVSTNPPNVREIKRKKYTFLMGTLRQWGFDVQWIDAVVDIRLNELMGLINKLSRLGLIKQNHELKQRKDVYFEMIDVLIEQCKMLALDPAIYSALLMDKRVMDIDLDQYPDLDNYIETKIDRTELGVDELAYWVRLECDRAIKAGEYDFDVTEDSINTSFDNILKDMRQKENFSPKSTIKVVANLHEVEQYTDLALLEDYVKDITTWAGNKDEPNFALDFLPTTRQVEIMKSLSPKDKYKNKEQKVFGRYQYYRRNTGNSITLNVNSKLMINKHNRSAGEEVKTISEFEHQDCVEFINNYIKHLGGKSNKPAFTTNEFDAINKSEEDDTIEMKRIYDEVRVSNGVQLAQALSSLYLRLSHLKIQSGTKDNVFIPPNGSFIAVIPKEHAPISSKNCDMPFIFITRHKKTGFSNYYNESHYQFETQHYYYSISKLCRLNIDKIQSWNQAGYRLIVSASSLLYTAPKLMQFKEEVIGTLTLLLIDSHQRTSDFTDLLKYVSFMPFSEISMLNQLIEDKMKITLKTRLDVWMFYRLKEFMIKLTDKKSIGGTKPRPEVFAGQLKSTSFGVKMTPPCFININARHDDIQSYIEEVSLLHTIRPKHLYGSQFLDKSITQSVIWQIQYENEMDKYGSWITEGVPNQEYPTFPFDSKFAFCRDAIIHAKKYFDSYNQITEVDVCNDINKSKLTNYMIYNCSLRGCTKEMNDRKNKDDFHSTSLNEAVKYARGTNYDGDRNKAINIAAEFLNSGEMMSFSMSEKDQRGGGRPIAAPTFRTKATLMAIEIPEIAIGKFTDNNIIVAGKNKLKIMSDTYKCFVGQAVEQGFGMTAQITEDQTKFSEMDNIDKYIPYIKANSLVPSKIRRMQIAVVKSLKNREHIVHRIPKAILNNNEYKKYTNDEGNGIKISIGWPQGMFNNISTSIHCIADTWITKLFKVAYPEIPIYTKGLVNSDDSWVAVAFNSMEHFRLFVVFRIKAKVYFCLKLNMKKLWCSTIMGEMVSNFNINGTVHLSVMKTISNCLTNLTYQNWVNDCNNVLSSVQQAYRNGCDISILILLKTVLKQQLFDSYQIKGKHKELVYKLPIDLGGFPNQSVFELAVNGGNSHYSQLLNFYEANPHHPCTTIVKNAIAMSNKVNAGVVIPDTSLFKSLDKRSKYKQSTNELQEEDYFNVSIANRGDCFTAVKHLLPISKSMKETISNIKSLPYIGNGLFLVDTRPKEFSIALGNFKEQVSNRMFELAAEHYTQSVRRLAISQALQSSGKVVRITGYPSMTMCQMLEFFLDIDQPQPEDLRLLKVAFTDGGPLPYLSEKVVHRSSKVPVISDNRKVISKLPAIENSFSFTNKVQNVLLYTYDYHHAEKVKKTNSSEKTFVFTSRYFPNSVLEYLEEDRLKLETRFKVYFSVYNLEAALNIIMQQYYLSTKSKLWVQPKCDNTSLETFLCDLYGKTLSKRVSYDVRITYIKDSLITNESKDVETIYNTLILDKMYPGSFKIKSYKNKDVYSYLKNMDNGKLDHENKMRYAICRYVLNNNDTVYLEKYSDDNLYTQVWNVPQKRDAKGSYYGNFEVTFKYGKIVAKVRGDTKSTNMIINTAHAPDLIMGMYIFVSKNFPHLSYSIPAKWYECPIWTNKNKFQKMKLSSLTNTTSIITDKEDPTFYNYPLTIDPTLKYSYTVVTKRGYTYDVDHYLRVVTRRPQGDNSKPERVGTAKQTMRTPNKHLVKLEPNIINSLSNSDLYRYNIIQHLTHRNYGSINKENIYTCINNSLNGPNGSVLVEYWANIASIIPVVDKISILEPTIGKDNVEILDIDVEDYSIMNFAQVTEYVPAESLDAVQAEFSIESNKIVGSLAKHDNIINKLCEITQVSNSLLIDKQILALITRDNYLVNKLVNINEELGENLVEVREDMNLIDIHVFMYIVGNNLHHRSTFGNFTLSELKDYKGDFNSKSVTLFRIIKRSIMRQIYDDEEEADKDTYALLMGNN